MERCEPIIEKWDAWPWAIIFFRVEFRLLGHLASLRGTYSRLPMTCYSECHSAPVTTEQDVPPVSVLFVPRKAILRDLAHKTPFAAPAWRALKDCDEDKRWICISDAPPLEWVGKTASGDRNRYLEARQRERRRLELPGYESLEDQADYVKTLTAFRDHDFAGMQIHARRLIQKFPHRPRVHMIMASASRCTGDFRSAMEHYREAIRFQRRRSRPLVRCLRNRAAEWMNEESLEKDVLLETADRIASETSEDAAAAWVELVMCYGMLGNDRAALRACKCGIESFPDNPTLHALKAAACSATGDLDGAIEANLGAIRLKPDIGPPWTLQGEFFLAAGRTGEAARCFQRSAKLGPHFVSPWKMLGRISMNHGKFSRGAKYYKKALSLDPEDGAVWNDLCCCCAQLGRGEEAIDAGRKAVGQKPNMHTWASLGMAYRVAGRPKPAIDCFLQAIRLEWDYANAWYNLGLTYLQTGDREKARNVIDQLSRLDLAWTALLRDKFDAAFNQ
jgi:tetratricopeptide (TPR) repeat protein